MLTTMVIVKTQLHNNKDKGSGTGGHGVGGAECRGGSRFLYLYCYEVVTLL